jgi:phosphate transport system protein
MKQHRHFEDELEKLKKSLVAMAGLAEAQVANAVASLLERDTDRAREVIEGDGDIDDLELQVDNQAVQLLALQQPMARDLRFITMAMKIGNDLERVGDHAVNIAQNVAYIVEAPPLPHLPELEEMVGLATDMLNDALDAFVRADSGLAGEIGRRDDRVDELHENVFRILLTHMMEDPRKIGAGIDMILVSRNLERIADLATNVAEDVVFMVEGRTIKHHAHETKDARHQ